MKNNRKLIMGGIAVIVLAVVMVFAYKLSRPDTAAGSKTYILEVVHKDESKKTFTYSTDEEFLGAALLAEGIIAGEDSQYGLFVTEVDGEVADYSADQSYWAFYINDEFASTGVDQTPVEDNGIYAMVYTIG